MSRPAWMQGADPWLVPAMAHHAALARGEKEILAGAAAAMEEFLAQARTGLLSGAHGVFLDGWPQNQVWFAAVERHLLPAVGAVWDRAHGARPATDRRQLYLDKVAAVTATTVWPQAVFAEVRREMAQGQLAAEDAGQIRARVRGVLSMDALPRAERDAALAAGGQPGEDGLTAGVRARAAGALDKVRGVWRTWAQRIARTLCNSAVNEAAVTALLEDEERTGAVVMKRWVAVMNGEASDTREWHKRAHGQQVPVDQPFMVNGEPMMYPGDPTASTANTANCRCTLMQV